MGLNSTITAPLPASQAEHNTPEGWRGPIWVEEPSLNWNSSSMLLWVRGGGVCKGMTAEGQWQAEDLGHIPERGSVPGGWRVKGTNSIFSMSPD